MMNPVTPVGEYHTVTETTYRAKPFKLEFHRVSFEMSGTLDGELDFVMRPIGKHSRTVQLSMREARRLQADLAAAIDDVYRNCAQAIS